MSTNVAEQFETAAQQREAGKLGMWIFLATEVLLFGCLFLAYTVYRFRFPEGFAAGSNETLVVAGSVNTAILLFSSFLVALAAHAAQRGSRLGVLLLLWTAAAIGLLFLGIKAWEYHHEIREGLFPGPHFHFPDGPIPGVEMFFVLYFTMTFLHAVHVAIGATLLAVTGYRVFQSSQPADFGSTTHLVGLYWHFVDTVWIFLFPLCYLVARHQS